MIDKAKEVEVYNRFDGSVGYRIPELRVERQFAPGEKKVITVGELEQLSYIPGGRAIMDDYLVIKDQEVLKELLNKKIEPEYYYSEDDIKRLFTKGSLDEFVDCLNFAPEGVIEMIKKLAVELPLQDMSKRNAILDKTGFNVTSAIEAKNAPFDDNESANSALSDNKGPVRRAAVPNKPSSDASVRKVIIKEQ